MSSKRNLRSQVTPDDEEDETLALEARKPPTKKSTQPAKQTPKRSSSSRNARNKQPSACMDPPDIEEQRKLLPKDKERQMRSPWIPDVLQKLPDATDIESFGRAPQRTDQVFAIYVKYGDQAEACILKVFGDYSAGWAESVMVEKMEEICPEAAIGKIKPMAHGPCVHEIKNFGHPESEQHIITYFALFLLAGSSVDLLGYNDLKWPLQTLCISIHSMLQSFAAADPKTSKFKFYHGDSDDSNYMVSVESKSICMIDFGRSFFSWSDEDGSYYFTPTTESRPQKTNDVLTFYSVIKKLLKSPNSAVTKQNEESWSDLAKFVSRRRSVASIDEPYWFKSWCNQHGIVIE